MSNMRVQTCRDAFCIDACVLHVRRSKTALKTSRESSCPSTAVSVLSLVLSVPVSTLFSLSVLLVSTALSLLVDAGTSLVCSVCHCAKSASTGTLTTRIMALWLDSPSFHWTKDRTRFAVRAFWVACCSFRFCCCCCCCLVSLARPGGPLNIDLSDLVTSPPADVEDCPFLREFGPDNDNDAASPSLESHSFSGRHN